MNKKISSILFVLLGLSFFLGSCSDDDNDKNKISEEWIEYQKSRVADVVALKEASGNSVYDRVLTDYGAGKYIYEKPSSFITDILEKNEFLKGGPLDGLEVPEKEKNSAAITKAVDEVLDHIEYDTDIAVVRYHGYFYAMDGTRYVFDGTETDSQGNKLNNPKPDVKFQVGGLIEGFKTGLYGMKVGDEKIICIPYAMGYGVQGTRDQYGNVVIPGYTTLFFDVKLLGVERDR